MFDQTFVTGPAKTRTPWSVAVSLTLQAGLVAILLILPLLHIAALQPPERTTIWLPLQPPPRPVEPVAEQVRTAAPAPRRSNVFTAPMTIPTHIDMTPDLAVPDMAPVLAGPATSGPLGGLGMSLGGTAEIHPPARVVIAPPAAPAAPLRVSGGAQAARLVFGPKPAYPPLAKAARVQGVVRIQAVIGLDGAIKNLQVVSGPPLLVAAAIAAVRQWRYEPTLLSGQPVEVATDIEVNFALN
jgi:protein TonB